MSGGKLLGEAQVNPLGLSYGRTFFSQGDRKQLYCFAHLLTIKAKQLMLCVPCIICKLYLASKSLFATDGHQSSLNIIHKEREEGFCLVGSPFKMDK